MHTSWRYNNDSAITTKKNKRFHGYIRLRSKTQVYVKLLKGFERDGRLQMLQMLRAE